MGLQASGLQQLQRAAARDALIEVEAVLAACSGFQRPRQGPLGQASTTLQPRLDGSSPALEMPS